MIISYSMFINFQALDNPGDELCEKNANLIRASKVYPWMFHPPHKLHCLILGLTKLCEDITEVLMELRYETLELDPPA